MYKDISCTNLSDPLSVHLKPLNSPITTRDGMLQPIAKKIWPYALVHEHNKLVKGQHYGPSPVSYSEREGKFKYCSGNMISPGRGKSLQLQQKCVSHSQLMNSFK